MFCRPHSGNILESKGGVEMGETILLGLGWIPQSETPPLRNEAPLYCVALRSSLDYEVAWRAVKGQDERQKKAPLTALHATWELVATSEKKIRRAATSALTFMTFSSVDGKSASGERRNGDTLRESGALVS